MAYQNILVETNNRISVLTINRPDKRNALNQATRDEMRQARESLERSPESRVLVITGAGDKAFVAGADINEFEGRTALMQHDAMKGLRIFDAIEEFPKPVIAMINGFCLGGGLETALACDIRVAADSAKPGQPEINLGIIPGGGGTQRLTRLVGEGNAMEIILTSEAVDAAPGEEIGRRKQWYGPSPASEGVGNALPVDGFFSGHQIRPAGFQVALDHHSKGSVVTADNLSGDIVADLELTQIIFLAVGVAQINHDSLSQT